MVAKPKNKAGMDAAAVARMMAAQDQDEAQPAPVPAVVHLENPTGEIPHGRAFPPGFDPGKIDGRTLRKTGREPFATRIKPETHESLRRIAYARGCTIAEALELAVAAFARN